MALHQSQLAPDFTLYDSEQKNVRLSDYTGKKNVLLLFFPLAFTAVCTKQLCGVRDDLPAYINENVQVFGISVDSAYVLAKFKLEQNLNYPLLSDFNKEVSAMYEVLYDTFSSMHMKGVSKRAAFLIDKQRILQYVEMLENPGNVPDSKAITEAISRLDK